MYDPWKPREILFPVVDNGSYTPLRSDLSYTYLAEYIIYILLYTLSADDTNVYFIFLP